MINENYYKGFEGEKDLDIYYYQEDGEKTGLKIWDGYFELLLSACWLGQVSKGGLLECYADREGFYEEKPWRISNIDVVIKELLQYSPEFEKDISLSMKETLSVLQKDLLMLLDFAVLHNKDIYIDFD